MQSPVVPREASLTEIHRYLLSLDAWLKNLHLTGLQATPVTQNDLNSIVSSNELTQSGKFFYNTDDGQHYKSTVVGGNITITVVG